MVGKLRLNNRIPFYQCNLYGVNRGTKRGSPIQEMSDLFKQIFKETNSNEDYYFENETNLTWKLNKAGHEESLIAKTGLHARQIAKSMSKELFDRMLQIN